MKKIFARIGMELTVTDEEYERLFKEYSLESDLTEEDARKFLEKGTLFLCPYTDSYIPQSEFDEPRNADEVTWDNIFDDAMGTAGMDYRLKVKDNARAYITGYAKEKFGIDIESEECPEDAIEDFLKEHPECDRFNTDGQMLIAFES